MVDINNDDREIGNESVESENVTIIFNDSEGNEITRTTITKNEYIIIERAAKAEGMSIEEFIIKGIEEEIAIKEEKGGDEEREH